MSVKFTIYINEAKFTANEATIDLVTEAIKAKGFAFDPATEGWVSPDFYGDDDEDELTDEAVYGPWGAPYPPTAA
ncbi:hypothetical protein [Nitratireductor rhodophyticola]|uniref:hypothetical protein n=1 Tax=Nitratireductor rhodophyticola TaxID=2854036 RepID=UPI003BA98996